MEKVLQKMNLLMDFLKNNQINNFAKQNEHPLVSDIEPIDEED